MTTGRGMIYFVTDGDAIKIGFAKNVRKRLSNLESSCHFPLFLLGSIPGTRDEERLIHNRFAHLRLKGEWFVPHTDIAEFIDEFEAAGALVEGDSMGDYRRRVERLP